MRFKKLFVFLIIILFTLSSTGLLIPVKAGTQDTYSTVTTGLSLNGCTTNQGQSVIIGNFIVFSTDTELLFYDSLTGALIKTWNLPFTYSAGGGGSYAYYTTNIIGFNSTAIMVATSYDYYYGAGSYSYTVIESWILNVNSLVYKHLGTSESANNAYGDINGGLVLVYSNSNFYAVFGSKNNLALTYVYELYPSYTSKGSSNTFWLCGVCLTVPSQTSNTVYILGSNTVSGLRYNIYKIDLTTPSFSNIGSGGADNDYSSVNDYLIDYSYDTSNTGDSYYDLLISYPATTSAVIEVRLIRFNDTYVSDTAFTNTVVSNPVNIERCIGALLPYGLTGIGDLTTGNYAYYYTGVTYNLFMQGFILANLLTNSPSLTPNTPLLYGTNGVPFQHKFASANNIGGFQPLGSGVTLMLDYQNSYACSDSLISLNPIIAYTFTLNPTQITSLGNVLELSQGTSYAYNGYLFINNEQNSTGTYTIQTSSIFAGSTTSSAVSPLWYSLPIGVFNIVSALGYYALISQINSVNVITPTEGADSALTGLLSSPSTSSFSNGIINFNLNSQSSSEMVYQKIQLNITTTNYGNTVKLNETYIIQYDYNGKTSLNNYNPSPTPTSTTPPTGNITSTTIKALIVYAICLIGSIMAFFYLHNNNIPFAFGLGLILGTIICNFMNLLGFYTYPIDALVMLSIVGIIVFMRH